MQSFSLVSKMPDPVPVYPEAVIIEAALNGLEEVVWTDDTGVTVDGNSLSKPGAAGWDAGAISTRQILAGEGYVESTVGETDTLRAFGLSLGDVSQSYTDIAFGFYLKEDGNLYYLEDSVFTLIGAYASGDVLRVSIERGEVKYYQNGTLRHTSTGLPTYPLLLDAALYSQNSTIQNVVVAGSLSGNPAGDPVYTELPDVQLTPIMISRGIPGTTVRDRVATTGTMTFVLDNSANNSQGKLGLYSLNHTNTLTGWRYGIPIRCLVRFLGVDEPVFVGSVVGVEPVSGKYRDRKVTVSCVDWMEEATSAKVSGIPVQIDKRSNEVFEVLVEAVDKQPLNILIGFGGDLYPYSLDNALDEEVNVMSEFQRLAQSELGYIFVSRNGTLVFQGRHRRPNLFTLSETLDGKDITEMDTSRGREELVNLVKIQIHPRRVDSEATTVLFDYVTKQRIERGTSVVINALYRDPDLKATRVGGIDMVSLVATTDYTFNTEEDGSGVDITSQLIVTTELGGNSAEIHIENPGPRDGYLTKLQCRGKGVYDYETVLSIAESPASVALYGNCGLSLDMPYQSNLGVADDMAAYLIANCKALLTQVKAVSFAANAEERLLRAALQLDISSRIRVEEDVTGTAGTVPVGETDLVSALEFFINAVELSIQENGIIFVTWTLVPADAYTYWVLEKPGFSELDISTRLGYGTFVTGWVVDESEMGISTRVNP
jgi:hypothetical protein